MKQNNIQSILKGHSLIPVVTFEKGDNPIEFVEYLMKQKVNCIEITLRTDFALDAIKIIKENQAEGFVIGAGTVVQSKQVDQLKELDIDFMVSPAFTNSLIEKMENSGIAYLPGVSTSSDIMQAMELGLSSLKFFPASLFGGVDALKTYHQVFGGVQFCPTGGINKMSSNEYLKLPNVFAVGGSWFQKEYKR